MRLALALALVASTVGCGGGDGGSPSASPSGSAAPPVSAKASEATNAGPAPAPPDDLDVASLQKPLKCANDAKSGVCGVLAKFSTCKGWNAATPAGDGRWIGRGFVVEKGKSTDAFVMVRARRVPTSEVGPGQLGAKVAIDELTKSDKDAYDAADRAIRILERQDVAPRFNPTLDYLKKRTEWTESFATATRGGSVYLLTKGGAFVCQGSKQQLLVVERSATRGGGAGADGLYAEVWATSW